MLQIYIEKFSLWSFHFCGINKVFYKKKDAHRNLSMPFDHSELGASLRREKVTPSEYHEFPKDPNDNSKQQPKS